MRAKPHKYTKEQIEFVRKNIKGTPYKKMRELFNDKFGTNLNDNQIKRFLFRYNLRNGIDRKFQKGQTAWNENMKGLDLAGENGKKTQFKKGQKPMNYKPVGYERVCKRDGYVKIKVSDTGRYQDRWKLKHRIVWEKAYGKIPENHTLIIADGNKENLSLDNLVLVSRSELALLNKQGLIDGNADTLRAYLTVIRLENRINDFELRGGDVEKYEEYLAVAEKNGIGKGTFQARLRRGWNLKESAYLPKHERRRSTSNA